MPKTKSFVDKQDKKISSMIDYRASLLRLYERELNEKLEADALEFSKTHTPEETDAFKAEQIVKNQQFLDKKGRQLDKKIDNQRKRFERKNSINSRRIWEIDFLRGLVIIGMLFDHFMFDFIGLFTPSYFSNLPNFYIEIGNFASLYWVHAVRIAFRFIGLFLLLFLSGISTTFSRNPLRRSLVVLGAGALISIAFLIVSKITGSEEDLVIVGAVACIGICMLICSLFKLGLSRYKKVYKWLVLGIAIAILIPWIFISKEAAENDTVFWFYYNGNAVGSVGTIEYLYSLKQVREHLFEVLLGTKYFGSDWMGLFPNLGYMFLGVFVGETVYKNKKSIFGKYNEKLNKYTLPVIVPGRYSLWFYLTHQVIYIIILGAIALIMGAQLSL